MKIFDNSKFLASLYGREFKNDEEIFMWLRILYKQEITNEKLFLITNKNFKINKSKMDFENDDIKKVFAARNAFLKQKIERKEIERVTISQTFNIKSFGNIASNITEIKSCDPRFLLLWVYNANIKMNINPYSKFSLKASGLSEFTETFRPSWNLKSKKDWSLFLSLFPFSNGDGELINDVIKGFGQKGLEKCIQDLTIGNITKVTKLDANHIDERSKRVEHLIREMA